MSERTPWPTIPWPPDRRRAVALDPAVVFGSMTQARDLCDALAKVCELLGQWEAAGTLHRADRYLHDQLREWWAMKHPGDLEQR